jgi:hypothetical protein
MAGVVTGNDILQRGQLLEQANLLKSTSQSVPDAALRAHANEIYAVKRHCAGIRLTDAAHQIY